jgi:hypothetical protein
MCMSCVPAVYMLAQQMFASYNSLAVAQAALHRHTACARAACQVLCQVLLRLPGLQLQQQQQQHLKALSLHWSP